MVSPICHSTKYLKKKLTAQIAKFRQKKVLNKVFEILGHLA